jgi:hypothetical protein
MLYLQVLLGQSSGALVVIQVENGFQEGDRLLGVFVPHGGAGVDAGDVIGRIDFIGQRVGTALRTGIAVIRIRLFVVAVLLAQLHIGGVDLF